MNENEYKAQRAVGTIDFREAALTTKNKKVLARIVEDTRDPDAHFAVAMNPKTCVDTLTRLIIDRETSDNILDICVWHPVVTMSTLEVWMKREYIQSLNSARSRFHAFQAAEGVPQGDRITLVRQHPGVDWTTLPKFGQPYTTDFANTFIGSTTTTALAPPDTAYGDLLKKLKKTPAPAPPMELLKMSEKLANDGR